MSTENAQVVIDEPAPVDLARDICAMSDNEDFEAFAEAVRDMAPYIITSLARAVLGAAHLSDRVEVSGPEILAALNGDHT